LQHRQVLDERCNGTVHGQLELGQPKETRVSKYEAEEPIEDVLVRLGPWKSQVEQARYSASMAYVQWLANMLQ